MMSTFAVRNSFVKRSAFATPLFQLAVLLRVAAYGIHKVATRLNTWLERRRAVAAAVMALNAMTERELRDIGLTRFDVQNATCGVSTLEADLRHVRYDDDDARNLR
jgi:uncharacterized protein YjiS (DUF1127 family)